MGRYRVAIIGTGAIARHHAGYYLADERTEIVAGADINPHALAEFCGEFSIPSRYESYQELLAKEKPDIVSVCTWTASHPEITIAAVEAGVKGIICEKPMGQDAAGPREMVRLCAERGVPLAIHHQTRFSPPFVAARAAVARGDIGAPTAALLSCRDGLLNIGSHTLDSALYVLGDPEPKWVLGQAERSTNRYERGTICEDRCAAVVGVSNAVRLFFDCDLPEIGHKQERTIIGTEGIIVLDGQSGRVMRSSSTGWELLHTEPQPTYLEEFIRWLEGGPEHRCAGRYALAAHEIMMALYESAKTRRTVDVPVANPGSGLRDMVEAGDLPVSDEPYDIRSEAALRYTLGRT